MVDVVREVLGPLVGGLHGEVYDGGGEADEFGEGGGAHAVVGCFYSLAEGKEEGEVVAELQELRAWLV